MRRNSLPGLGDSGDPCLRVPNEEPKALPQSVDSQGGSPQKGLVTVNVRDLLETKVDEGHELLTPHELSDEPLLSLGFKDQSARCERQNPVATRTALRPLGEKGGLTGSKKRHRPDDPMAR
jgi:hypothetical protein